MMCIMEGCWISFVEFVWVDDLENTSHPYFSSHLNGVCMKDKLFVHREMIVIFFQSVDGCCGLSLYMYYYAL